MAQQLRRGAVRRPLARAVAACCAAAALGCLLWSVAYLLRNAAHLGAFSLFTSHSPAPLPDDAELYTPLLAPVRLEAAGPSLRPYTRGENLAEQVNLHDCLREPPGTNETWMTADMYLAHHPTRLVLDTALVSPLRSPVDVALVVTYSVSRLHMLDGLCLSWGGPISAAVYQELNDDPPSLTKDEPLRNARYLVSDAFERARQQETCALDIMLFTEQVPRADAIMANLFPVNALRNRALLLTRTSLVLVIDGDLLVQTALRSKLATAGPDWARVLSEAQAGAFHVLPAFDTKSTSLAYAVAAGDKVRAVAAYESKFIVRFGAKNSRFPQGCTDYDRWVTETEQYEVTYCNRYEPWGLVSRLLTPWFDARLRGYGRNKIMYSAALNSSGFAFNIDPDAFVIHRPHTKSTAQRIFDDENDRRVHNHIMDLWNTQKADGSFVPVVDDTTLNCRARLPWWRDEDVSTAEAAAPRLRLAAQRAVKTAAKAQAEAAEADAADAALVQQAAAAAASATAGAAGNADPVSTAVDPTPIGILAEHAAAAAQLPADNVVASLSAGSAGALDPAAADPAAAAAGGVSATDPSLARADAAGTYSAPMEPAVAAAALDPAPLNPAVVASAVDPANAALAVDPAGSGAPVDPASGSVTPHTEAAAADPGGALAAAQLPAAVAASDTGPATGATDPGGAASAGALPADVLQGAATAADDSAAAGAE